jgi:hypothetical protein
MVCTFCHGNSGQGSHNIRTCEKFKSHYGKELAMAAMDFDVMTIIKNILVEMAVPGINLVFCAKEVYDNLQFLDCDTKTQRDAELVLLCVNVAKKFVGA